MSIINDSAMKEVCLVYVRAIELDGVDNDDGDLVLALAEHDGNGGVDVCGVHGFAEDH